MQCYIYLLYISCFTNKCEIGSLDIIEYSQTLFVIIHTNSKKI